MGDSAAPGDHGGRCPGGRNHRSMVAQKEASDPSWEGFLEKELPKGEWLWSEDGSEKTGIIGGGQHVRNECPC